jgi:CheY-like chemotaxis protein
LTHRLAVRTLVVFAGRAPHKESMNKILVVDDDALILHLYRQKFSDAGFDVQTAGDGVAAIRFLHGEKPDVVVLDLMMPRLSGAEVLKFIRNDPRLKATPVLILSNSFMGEMFRTASELGIQGALYKSECKPNDLLELVQKVLQDPHSAGVMVTSVSNRVPVLAPGVAKEFSERAPDALSDLRAVCQSFIRTTETGQRTQQLAELYRRARQVTAIAGFAEQPLISLFTGAFEALLFELCAKPAAVTPSVIRTVLAGVDFIGELFERVRDEVSNLPLAARIMLVDDDPISNRIIVEAMRRVYLECQDFQNPTEALEVFKRTPYDLVLLDIEMPGLDGFEFCKQLRQLPGYARTPVIYVTSHSGFEHRAKGILSGGDDLIAKPVFPMELAVKTIILLLRSRLPQLAMR